MRIISKNRGLFRDIGYLCLSFFLVGCDNNDPDPVNESELLRLKSEIRTLATSVDCTDSFDWSFTAIGSKACGGPSGYIAYSKQIDTVAFLDKVHDYTEAQKKYNQDNGIISDCAIEPVPLGLICQDNEAVLIYTRCELIPDSGPCFASFRRYYFDQEEQKCKEFVWGGCDGVVPFESLEECRLCE